MAEATWIGACVPLSPEEAARRIARVLAGGDPGPFGRFGRTATRGPAMIPARPGKGGRRPRIDRTYVTEQTQQLIAELGEPLIVRSYQAATYIWELDAAGDGCLVGRLSADDLRGGETAFSQVHALRALAERQRLRSRYVVVSLRMSGTRQFEHRVDFAFTLDKVRQGAATWVAWRGPDRVARETLPAELYYHHLRQAGARLFMSDLGREIDWDADRLYLSTHNILSEQEVLAFRRRSHTPIVERYVKPGKGWPGAVKYGFMRDLRGWVVVDPEAWPFIEEIHYGFATLAEDGRGSLRAMERHVKELGCPMSHGMVRTILRDPIYVTGEWSNTIGGEIVPARTIDIPRPIPAEVFERNQALLALNHGKHTRNPVGTFLLNAVMFRHADCRNEVRHDRQVRLAARSLNNGENRYYHYPATPARCRGYSLNAAAVDACVIGALLRLAQSPELQAAWTYNAVARWRDGDDEAETAGEQVLSPERGADLLARIRSLEKQRARLLRDYVDAAAEDAPPDTASVTALLDALEHEIAAQRRMLELTEQAEAYRRRKETPPEHRELLERLRETLTAKTPSDPDKRQRRAAIVAAALSEVIVHDTPTGPALELHGPLLPSDGPLVPIDPLSTMAPFLRSGGSSRGDDNPTVRYRHAYETVWKASRPAWTSPPLPLPAPVHGVAWRRRNDHAEGLRLCREAVAVLEPLLPHGRIRGTNVAGKWDLLAREYEYPSIRYVRKEVNRHGVTIGDVYRDVLGPELALRRGRIGPRTAEELVLTLAWALLDGFQPGPGWRERFDAFQRGRAYLVTATRVRQLAREFGCSPHELWDRARVLAADGANATDRL